MRVFSRVALTLLAAVLLVAPSVKASHLEADCPLRLVAANASATPFFQSPHGAFRSGSQVFVLRGQTLTTFSVTDLGDIQVAREDFVGTLGGRESAGGVAFANGFMYISSDAGLEIFDLRAVRAGGSAPLLVSRTPDLHYRRLAISGNTLAGVFPAYDFPCVIGGPTPNCFNSVDLFTVGNPAAPRIVASLSSSSQSIGGFNDVAFNYGFLVVTGEKGTAVYNISNPSLPGLVASDPTPGTFLVSNGANLLSVGNDTSILTFGVSSVTGGLTPMFLHTLATLRLEHGNPIMFHRQATFDEANGRLITLVDEMNPQTLQPARTFAFDVFDYIVPMFEGKDPREYEQVSYTQGDEIKYNPLAVGPFVYVIGEVSGVQEYGACGQLTGRIEWSGLAGLPCGGADIHGWVTATNRIANVEFFLDGGSLGSATLFGPDRIDIPSTTPVQPWRIAVNLDTTARGDHLLRAVATDINGNRRQFASQRVFFSGPGGNCFTRRRLGLNP
ncbi:MAG TPA: hypothetical protein VER58_06470 [Thermoanaerobaculia bacterium]|nr:hypothetical protein [Thermoanaerobaculia bacterium]